MEFLHEFYQKLVEFVFLGFVAFAGIKLGIAKRKKKNAMTEEAALFDAQLEAKMAAETKTEE